ncbi:AI-2E family transporter [Oryzicola mucosus]|uniref:AI-2E family transporter n=1 Tax=Oryzicola mucosus TaxID=2767425 RepID=UPI0038B231E2
MASRNDAIARTKLSGFAVLTIIAVVAILRIGEDIFVPLALALLLTFAIAPIVSFLRRRSVPKIAAVIVTVAMAFFTITVFSFIVATQVANLAQNIPTYQRNITQKVQSFTEAGAGSEWLKRLNSAVERVGAEIETRAVQSQMQPAPEAVPAPIERQPLPVEIVDRANPIETLGNLILPLIKPFATAGLVIVLVIFMLIEREGLRDRFIRLVGLGDLHRTTAALQDAGKRVGKYLLMQLVVNSLYAFPITLGLWFLGIPNAILWGLLTLVLRFVPYIGPVIGMVLPLFLALAISPGWSLVFWVAALFLVTELVSNNVVEPWLYGSQTGLSPLAIIISAIFWSWLWGPLGLMLSTPLTVCLVVLGKHVPQFGFLDVLLGNEPVLEPREKLYQRLLSGDPDEATDNAEEFLKEEFLVDYYEKVGIPALLLGETDRQRGVMSETQMTLFSSSAETLVDNLSDIADEEENEEEEDAAAPSDETDFPDGKGRTVLCVGGRGAMDDAAAMMLAQVLEVEGAEVSKAQHTLFSGRMSALLPADQVETIVIAFLNGNSKSQARQIVRRVKRFRPGTRVGLFIPMANGQDSPIIAAEDTNADFVSSSLTETVRSALTVAEAVDLKVITRRLSRSPHGRAKLAAA